MITTIRLQQGLRIHLACGLLPQILASCNGLVSACACVDLNGNELLVSYVNRPRGGLNINPDQEKEQKKPNPLPADNFKNVRRNKHRRNTTSAFMLDIQEKIKTTEADQVIFQYYYKIIVKHN